MWKYVYVILFIIPFKGMSQKVKVNRFDKFSRQMMVMMEPQTVFSREKAKISINFLAEGQSLYVVFNGYGWGGNSIDVTNDVIFLFSNDSVVSVKSTGFQSYEQGLTYSTYKHQYRITVKDLEMLSKLELVGIRKYSFKSYEDMTVAKDYATKVKKMSALFIDELKKAKIIRTLQYIELSDIAKHIDDSVLFCSHVFNAKYLDRSEKKPTFLNITEDVDSQPVSILIWGDDRKVFNNAPEKLYHGRDVCIQGVVNLYNNVPQIIIRDRNQIMVTSPIKLDDVAMFVGDSVSVSGRVAGSKYLPSTINTPTLLNMGKDYPNQALTLLFEKTESAENASQIADNYVKKDILVKGSIHLYKNKPEIKIYNKEQITMPSDDAMVMTASIKKQKEASKKSAEKTGADGKEKLPNDVLQKDMPRVVLDAPKIAQANQTTASKTTEPLPDGLAHFPGGTDAALSFVATNLKVPPSVRKNDKIIVWAKFTVNENGTLTNIGVTKKVDEAIYKETVRVISQMPPWVPTIYNGKPIASSITQLVTFVGTE